MDEIERIIIDNLQEQSDTVRLTPETPLLRHGILDSLALTALISYIEDHFRIAIPSDEILPENFATPGAIASLVRRLKE